MALPYPSKTFTAGQVPTTAQWNELNANDQALAAGTGLNVNAVGADKLATNAITLGYAEIAANFATASTSIVQVTGLSTTVTVPAGGRKVRVSAWATDIYQDTGGGSGVRASLWDGAVNLGTQISQSAGSTTANDGIPLIMQSVQTLSAGSKTFNVGLKTGAGTGYLEAGSSFKAFILVEVI